MFYSHKSMIVLLCQYHLWLSAYKQNGFLGLLMSYLFLSYGG